MGLSTIDENLMDVLEAMKQAPAFMGSFTGIAKIVGCCIALGVGSYEAWMMMLGRRGMDVMKILNIIIISICITSTGYITGTIDSITTSIESSAKGTAMAKADALSQKEMELATLQAAYLERIREQQDSVRQANAAIEHAQADGIIESIEAYINEFMTYMSDNFQRGVMLAEQKLGEWINDAIRFIGGLIFQMVLYGMFLAQRVFLSLLASVAPLMFALSLAPPWKSAWSQWMSKYITIGLWGWVAYVVLVYVESIMEYFIAMDIKAYEGLIGGAGGGMGTIGLMTLGTTCMYVVALLMGAFVLKMVPEAASWLIPGGVSSGAGSAIGGAVTGAATGASSHGQNAVSQLGPAGMAVAHPLSSTAKGVSAVAGAIETQAGNNLSRNQLK